MILTYKYRLYPNRTQEAFLSEMLAVFGTLYNAALQQRIEAYRRRGITLNYYAQACELKAAREADECLARYSFSAASQVLRRLDFAFAAFFRRVKSSPKRAGFPRFKAIARFDTATFTMRKGLTLKRDGRLGVVGIPGTLRVNWHRGFPEGTVAKQAIVSRKAGRWFVCFVLEVPDRPCAARQFAAVGVDVGLSNLVALSTGEVVSAPKPLLKTTKALRRAQRAVSRKKAKSRRERKARLRVARLHARVAEQRRDFTHKLSRSLADRFSHLAFEKLNVAGLKRGILARAVHDAAWSQLVRFMSYKASSAGGVVALVDHRGSSQTCPECGAVKPKRLSDRVHSCECGCVLDRDVAAARVILSRADFGARTVPQALSEQVAA